MVFRRIFFAEKRTWLLGVPIAGRWTEALIAYGWIHLTMVERFEPFEFFNMVLWCVCKIFIICLRVKITHRANSIIHNRWRKRLGVYDFWMTAGSQTSTYIIIFIVRTYVHAIVINTVCVVKMRQKKATHRYSKCGVCTCDIHTIASSWLIGVKLIKFTIDKFACNKHLLRLKWPPLWFRGIIISLSQQKSRYWFAAILM